MPHRFLLFDHYRIPRENLLNKTGDVTPDGRYVTSYKDPGKKHGDSISSLSAGRVGIVGMSVTYLTGALTVAVR